MTALAEHFLSSARVFAVFTAFFCCSNLLVNFIKTRKTTSSVSLFVHLHPLSQCYSQSSYITSNPVITDTIGTSGLILRKMYEPGPRKLSVIMSVRIKPDFVFEI